MHSKHTLIAVMLLTLGLGVGGVSAGSLDSPGPPTDPLSASYSLEDLYHRLETGAAGTPRTFTEPPSGPTAGTGHTLNEIMGKAPAPDNTAGAAPGDVLSGKTFWGLRTDGTWGVKSGTMSNNGPANFTPGAAAVSVPAGYYSGGQVNGDPNLQSGNIKSGTTIFGVAGSLVPRVLAKRVNKTGETSCWNSAGTGVSCTGTGQDGEYRYGIDPAIAPSGGTTGAYNTPSSWTGTRFTDKGDGTVTDNLTALTWLKNANCTDAVGGIAKPVGYLTWGNALTWSNSLASGACGLSDGSSAGQWRLPNINELHSLGPTWIPGGLFGSPFVNVKYNYYWSSSNLDPTYAWVVYMADGSMFGGNKTYYGFYVWPVRGGQ